MKLRGDECIQRNERKNWIRIKEETSCAKHAGAAGRNRVAANRNGRGERESSLRFFFTGLSGPFRQERTGNPQRVPSAAGGNPGGVSGI
jgi:hypothetical protein